MNKNKTIKTILCGAVTTLLFGLIFFLLNPNGMKFSDEVIKINLKGIISLFSLWCLVFGFIMLSIGLIGLFIIWIEKK